MLQAKLDAIYLVSGPLSPATASLSDLQTLVRALLQATIDGESEDPIFLHKFFAKVEFSTMRNINAAATLTTPTTMVQKQIFEIFKSIKDVKNANELFSAFVRLLRDH